MPTNPSLLIQYCDELALAVHQLRDTFRASISVKREELLDRFWSVQDHLHRVVALVSDDPGNLAEVQERYGPLISEVIDILGFTAQTNVGQLPAVTASCRAINDLLLAWQELKPPYAVTISIWA